VNRKVAGAFGALLILTGVLAFLGVPSPMSSAVPYDVFHVVFGVIGLACWREGAFPSKAFNSGFGAVDLYQALAQWRGWFPAAHFQWKPADLVMHVLLGVALIGLAAAAD
jgi:hypothetical protein